MRATTAAFALIGALTLAACGKDAEPTKPAAPVGTPAPAPVPAVPTPATPPPAPATLTSFTGTLEVQGITTTMQGTHQLREGGKLVCFLGTTSKTVDLKAHEGKKVKVTGIASPTVEPSPTPYVDVQTIEPAP